MDNIQKAPRIVETSDTVNVLQNDTPPNNKRDFADTLSLKRPFSATANISDNVSLARRCGTLSSAANLSAVLVGAGIISLPFAFASVGWGLGCILLALGALGSILGFHFLSACADELGGNNTSFGAVAWRTWPRISILVDIAVMLENMGVAVAHLIIIGGLMPKVVQGIVDVSDDSAWVNRKLWISIAFGALGAPLFCLRRLHGLKFTSMTAQVGLAFIMILGILHLAHPTASLDPCSNREANSECKGEVEAFFVSFDGIRRAMAIFIFSFAAHANTFDIYNEVINPSCAKMDLVTGTALTYGFILYAVFGLCGYFTYGSNVSDNILVDYPNTIQVTIARAIVCFNVAVAYPLANRPPRQAMIHLLQTVLDVSGKTSLTLRKSYQKWSYWGTTFAILASTYFTAFFVVDLGIVFEAMGSTNAIIITYVLPGLFFYKLFRDKHAASAKDKVMSWAALGLAVFGLSFMTWFLVTVSI